MRQAGESDRMQPDPAHATLGTSSILGGAVLQHCDNELVKWVSDKIGFHASALAPRRARQANHGPSNRQDYPNFDRRWRHCKHRLLRPVSLERRKISARAKGGGQECPPHTT